MQNKNLLIQKVKQKTGLPLITVKRIVNAFLYELNHALLRKERVQLTHVGVFTVVRRKPKMGMNMRIGKPVKIPSCLRVKFKESWAVRKLLNA